MRVTLSNHASDVMSPRATFQASRLSRRARIMYACSNIISLVLYHSVIVSAIQYGMVTVFRRIVLLFKVFTY